ncbi:Glutathione S-transferase [Hondaea fermentalgiana]|uniref:Glutathione S-transferase n=1 Tax=Hondaea fermentalgiana TaxID=2315210 RepID=A0A2R5GKK2_9STRA|nr:Glutathione S-transferase [Hondaea fermentalgiana]|eukprot:GBG30258.1 Glutathione S-transferase [Hondaea fermentalgiana]
MTKIKLTYFDIQGVAEKVRLAFVLNGVDFEDVRIKHAEWQELKPKTKFGQLPLMQIDDGEEVAQSDAMLRFAATLGAAKLMPKEPIEQLKVNEAMGLVDDIARSWMPAHSIGMSPQKFGYEEGFQNTDEGKAKVLAMRENWLKTELPKFMKLVTALIEANGDEGFLASKDAPTIADCHMVPLLRNYQRGFMDGVPTTSLDEFTTVTAYIKRFLSIPEVAKYYEK